MFFHKVDNEISLKLAELEDAEELFQLTDGSRDHLRKWLPWLDFTKTVEDTRAFIQSSRNNFSRNKSLTTIILYRGDIVGTAGFNEMDLTNHSVKIGYWLGEDFQGKGIMTRVVEALTNYAWKELNMNRVEIRVAHGNKKSASIPKRLGFKEEGRIRSAEWLYDHYVDHIIFGLLAHE
ncbi:ribosomal-protein-serine acetyltransferase [Halobacillus karajensis]|nr:GNAT family protein [Halobacillus karajensis]SEH63552.1 ribosomal-protein-serine acetyltransferase [Halobacillus karajensis]